MSNPIDILGVNAAASALLDVGGGTPYDSLPTDDGDRAPLYRWTMPNGAIYFEYVQAKVITDDGVACYFLALRDCKWRPVEASLWTRNDHELLEGRYRPETTLDRIYAQEYAKNMGQRERFAAYRSQRRREQPDDTAEASAA